MARLLGGGLVVEAKTCVPGPTSKASKIADRGLNNKLNHIFNKPEHKLGDFLSNLDGDQVKAFKMIEESAQSQILKNGLNGPFVGQKIIVNGSEITINGTVIDGVVKIGTAYIP